MNKNIVLPVILARHASIAGCQKKDRLKNRDTFIPPLPNPIQSIPFSETIRHIDLLCRYEFFTVQKEHHACDIALAALSRCLLISDFPKSCETLGFTQFSCSSKIELDQAFYAKQKNFDHALSEYVEKKITSSTGKIPSRKELEAIFLTDNNINMLISTTSTELEKIGHVGNVGDNFGLWISRYLSNLSITPVGTWVDKDTPLFLTIGSICQHARNRGIVWGSGYVTEIEHKENPVDTKSLFAGVRGPRTREQLLRRNGINPPVIGDPGLLISCMDKSYSIEQDIEIGFVLHGVDKTAFNRRYPGQFIVNNTSGYHDFIKDAKRCKRIVTSSLHGMIFCHSLGIPCKVVKFTDGISGGDFKFIDYHNSIGCYSFKSRDDYTESTPSIIDLIDMVDASPMPILDEAKELLKQTFPFPKQQSKSINSMLSQKEMTSLLSKTNKVRLRLLQGKSWRYLRYLHLRDCLKSIINEVQSVCICGAGHGIAEVALALEFPEVKFMLTDYVSDNYPNYHGAMNICWEWNVQNVEFSVWNVLNAPPLKRSYDLVCSTEVLEHIKEPDLASYNMQRLSSKYIYCLVPYSTVEVNSSIKMRKKAFERHEHQVCGFDEKLLRQLFGEPTILSGVYWQDAGLLLRQTLQGMSSKAIEENMGELISLAEEDLRMGIPCGDDAMGIKILARTDHDFRSSAQMPPTLADLGII